MQLNEHFVNGVTVLEVSGSLTVSDHPEVLRDRVATLAQEGNPNIVLNVRDLVFVDSACLGELVACYIRASRRGGTVKLANTQPRLRQLLKLTKLSNILESFESEASAIESFHVVAAA